MTSLVIASRATPGAPVSFKPNPLMKLSVLLFTIISATALGDTQQRWAGAADITFSGSSTLHDWTGKVSPRRFTTLVTIDETGKPEHVQASVTVEVAKMDTAEPKRDQNMRKAMKSEDHPLITATIDVPARKIAPDLKTPAKLPIVLTLLGRPQSVSATISNWKQEDGLATFDLDFPVSMKASGISVPPLLVFIRVGDVVRVHASVRLTRD